jgi:hypothetical protein
MISNVSMSVSDYYNAAELWLTKAIVKSIVEATLGVSIADNEWQFNWVEYYPVWTMDSMTREKAVKRINVRLSSGKEDFLEVNEDQLEPHGLNNYNELLLLFIQSGASRVSGKGIQIFKTRLDFH